MLLLLVGLSIFFLIHLIPTAPALRRGLIERFGAAPYRIAFSIVSIVSVALIVYGYAKLNATPGKNPQIWSPPNAMRHATMLLMLPAFILLAAAYIPSRIRTTVGHPMLAAIMLWSLGHLLVNGDLASIALFGSFLVYAVYDRISVTQRAALGPLGSRKGTITGDLAAIGVGTVAFFAMLLWGHARLIGIPLIPGWN